MGKRNLPQLVDEIPSFHAYPFTSILEPLLVFLDLAHCLPVSGIESELIRH